MYEKEFHSGSEILTLLSQEKRFTFATTFVLATRLARMVSKDFVHQFIGTLLERVNDSVVQRVLVLLKPVCNIVRHLKQMLLSICVQASEAAAFTHGSGIMHASEVSLRLARL